MLAHPRLHFVTASSWPQCRLSIHPRLFRNIRQGTTIKLLPIEHAVTSAASAVNTIGPIVHSICQHLLDSAVCDRFNFLTSSMQ